VFSNCGPQTTGGPQAVSGEKLKKTYTDLMKKYPYMSALKLPLLADLQQKVGELVLSITSCPIIIILKIY
jgi:hypothetical protein